MADDLSQSELDKLLADHEEAAGAADAAGGLHDDDFATLEALFTVGWTRVAETMAESLGQSVGVDFGVAANVGAGSVQTDLDALGACVHFSLVAGGEATHAVVLQGEDIAKLGALISGNDPEGAALTAESFQGVVELLTASLPAFASALRDALGQPVEVGAVTGVDAQDPGAEFDAGALGLDGPGVRLEYALTVGDAVACPLLYTMPLTHALALLALAPRPAPAGPAFAEFESAHGGASVDTGPGEGGDLENMDLILDIHLEVVARLGSVHMPIREILKLGPGSIIDIDRPADAPVDLVVNDKLVARGDIVVVQENFGLKISEVQSPQERIASLRR